MKEASPSPERSSPRRILHSPLVWGVLSVAVLLILLSTTGGIDLLARTFLARFISAPAEEAVSEAPSKRTASTFTFRHHPLHPDVLFEPYFGTSLQEDITSTSASYLPAFRRLLDLYTQRQGYDDNFTIRVIDNRTRELLELYTLVNARQHYEQTGEIDWDDVDQQRRKQTRRLREKYEQLGLPRDAITVKWGRANQVLEARERERAFIEYEIRLADYLGLSLLTTEIGTVETFNLDHLVSSVGARSRYQMMPYLLRKNDIHHYKLQTAYGNVVRVLEEWHPLLTMEPAFLLLRGYVNAVGHEIPGLSAYHAGPGNIYKLFRLFLTEHADVLTPRSTVVDAYVWGLTEGYDTISRHSSFGSYSRGYIPSAYGSLRATELLPIDTASTLRAERVQLKSGAQIYLSELLRPLDAAGDRLDWGSGPDTLSTYARFQRLNPHMVLPDADDNGTVPSRGDVRLVPQVSNAPVRFFLPIGGRQVLANAGLHVIDEDAAFRFDHQTYTPPTTAKTIWDDQYDDLVEDVRRFGFTEENRERLAVLVDTFEQLATEDSSHYRQAQLQIIQTHERIWSFGGWDKLASTVEATRGKLRLHPRPPTPLGSMVSAIPSPER